MIWVLVSLFVEVAPNHGEKINQNTFLCFELGDFYSALSQVFWRFWNGGWGRPSLGRFHRRMLGGDQEAQCSLHRWKWCLLSVDPMCFTFIFSDSKEVTGCDLGLLFQNNETAELEHEKLGQGGNRFKFWCKNATQRLVQKEAPYHKASCALDFLHWGMRWKSVRILDLKPWKNLLDRK